MKIYNIIIEKDEDGRYVGSVPSMQGCYSEGETIDELMNNMKEVIETWQEINDDEIEVLEFVGIQTLKI